MFEIKEQTNSSGYPTTNTSVFWFISLCKYIPCIKLSRGKDVDSICFILVWFFPSQKTSLCTRKCFPFKKITLID